MVTETMKGGNYTDMGERSVTPAIRPVSAKP